MSFMNESHPSLYIINNNKYLKKMVRTFIYDRSYKSFFELGPQVDTNMGSPFIISSLINTSMTFNFTL